MITTRLTGGLGNQLFQYALGRSLSLRHNTTLKLDLSHYANDTLRSYKLGNYLIDAEVATPQEIAYFKKFRTRDRKIIGPLYNMLFADSTKYIKEKMFCFDEQIEKLGDNVYLEGYWQTEKYFCDIRKTLLSDLRLKQEPEDDANVTIAAMMGEPNAVSLHVRRGDYVASQKTNATHGTCGPDYYERAIALMNTKVSQPHFFIFSDDLGWVKENLLIPSPATYVDQNGSDGDYLDLWLMSHAPNHIIANSSFSWWSAWLNNTPNKIVIAPKKWLAATIHDTNDIIPEIWYKI